MSALFPLTQTDKASAFERAREVSKAIAKTARHYDRTAAFPFANFELLRAAGLLSLPVLLDEGGEGAGLTIGHKVVSIIAEGEPSTALVLGMHYKNLASIAAGQKWPTAIGQALNKASVEGIALINSANVEPRLGSPSHGAAPDTSARLVDGKWRLNGRKRYCTGAPILSWITSIARTEEENPRIGVFLIPAKAEGVRIEETWDAIGLRATGTHDIVYDDVELPYDHFFDDNPLEEGLRRGDPTAPWHNVVIAATYDGVGRAARDTLIRFVKDFAPGSLGAPLATLARVQDAVGRIEVLLAANASVLRSVSEDADAGKASALDPIVAKHIVVDNVVEITRIALEIGGNQGLSEANDFQRHHRDALAGPAHQPQNDLARITIAKAALG